MSIDGPRFAAFLAFTERGMTPDDASACVMALHPLDDAPIPGQAFEKAVRSRSRSFAKDAKRALPAQALTLAHSALADYKALAQQHGEAYYQTRYDQYLPGRESTPPEARVTPPETGPAPSAPPPQAGSAPSAGGWWDAPREDVPPPPPTDAAPTPGPDGVNAAWNYTSPSRPDRAPSPYSSSSTQPSPGPSVMPVPNPTQRVPVEPGGGGQAAPPRSFTGAVSTCIAKYAVFSGRASRSEYWYFGLFTFLTVFGVSFLGFALLPIGAADALGTIAQVALLLPGLAVGVRRMHDLDLSGWFLLIPLYNFVLLVSPGTGGPNRFG